VVASAQPRNKLGNRRSKDDKMPTSVWKKSSSKGEYRTKKEDGKEDKKADRDEWKWTIEEKFDEEIELDREKVKEMVLQKFHKWLKVFGKVESERMPTRKLWDYAINLKKDFVSKKERTYLIVMTWQNG